MIINNLVIDFFLTEKKKSRAGNMRQALAEVAVPPFYVAVQIFYGPDAIHNNYFEPPNIHKCPWIYNEIQLTDSLSINGQSKHEIVLSLPSGSFCLFCSA